MSGINQALSPLTKIADYQIEQLIGQGSFARVYGVINIQDLRRPKRALLELIEQGDDHEKQLRLRSFKRTAEILEKLNHPSIPRAYSLFEHAGKFYLVQEFIEGVNYAEYLDGKNPPLSIAEIEQVFAEVLAGLATLHQGKIVHRDLKPSNLMRRQSDNSTAIVDFGSACDLSTLDALETILGDSHVQGGYTQIYTPGYAHPQQRDGLNPANFQWDLYALAKTIIALRLGKNPPWQQSWSVDNLGFSGKMTQLLSAMLKVEDCPYIDACDALKFAQDTAKSHTSAPLRTSPRGKVPGWYVFGAGIVGLSAIIAGSYFWLLPKYVQFVQERQAAQAPKCPNYVKSELNLPVPDSGFAVRFYYPETVVAGESTLEVWRDGSLLAQANDEIKGFIWVKALASGSNFPPGNYQLRLRVPESIPYEQQATLDPEFPFYYLGGAAALEVACALESKPQTSES